MTKSIIKKCKMLSLIGILLTGCVGPTEPTNYKIDSSLEVLENTWDAYSEQEKFYIFGGNQEQQIENKPAAFDLDEKTELENMFLIPIQNANEIENAATMIHGMNANIFSGAVFQLKDKSDVESFSKVLNESVENKKWLCGAPEQRAICLLNNKTIAFYFGSSDNVETFTNKLQKNYPKMTTDICSIEE